MSASRARCSGAYTSHYRSAVSPFTLFWLAALAIHTHGAAEAKKYRRHSGLIHELSPQNFTGFVELSALSVVVFYAPWCQHCISAEPKLLGAARQLAHARPPIPVARSN
jgi:thiol-disulfide isomerase/thioredoxin